MKKTRILASVMALVMCLSVMPMSAFAEEDGYHNIKNQASPTNPIDVQITVSSIYSVKIPKTIVNQRAANHSENARSADLEISYNLAANEVLHVEPDATVTLSSPGAEDVAVPVRLSTTSFTGSSNTRPSVTIESGTLKPGNWTGTFNFNIYLETLDIETE